MKHYKLTPPQARKLLVEALLSGEYFQGHGYLKIGNRFCCLGVACDLFIKHENRGAWAQHEQSADSFNWDGYRHEFTYLPPCVQDWLEFNSISGTYYIGAKSSSLALDNDENSTPAATFEEIARTIISNPNGLYR